MTYGPSFPELFFAPGSKIFLQQYRPKADMSASGLLLCKLTSYPQGARPQHPANAARPRRRGYRVRRREVFEQALR